MSLSDEIGAKSGTSSAYATLLKAKKAEFAALKKRRAALRVRRWRAPAPRPAGFSLPLSPATGVCVH